MAVYSGLRGYMEQESLFTSSKWDILKCLEKGNKSPIDLAKEAHTSLANVSQQLRLLELAGFVKSERISNREKGQPRVMYSLTENFSYLVVSSPGFVDKKFLKLEPYQKIICKIWFIPDRTFSYYLEKFFWSIEKHISKIQQISVDYSDSRKLNIFIVSENAEVKKSVKDTTIDGIYGTKDLVIHFVKETKKQENKENKLIVLYET
jgi:predicted transcriptional regulator